MRVPIFMSSFSLVSLVLTKSLVFAPFLNFYFSICSAFLVSFRLMFFPYSENTFTFMFVSFFSSFFFVSFCIFLLFLVQKKFFHIDPTYSVLSCIERKIKQRNCQLELITWECFYSTLTNPSLLKSIPFKQYCLPQKTKNVKIDKIQALFCMLMVSKLLFDQIMTQKCSIDTDPSLQK